MKKIIALLSVSALVLSGCFDSREYKKEADKKCEAELKTAVNLNELLLYALKSDASPSTIKKIIRKGASPNCTVGKNELPIICFAKSPNAMKAVYNADPQHSEKDGALVLIEHASRHLPLFYCQSPELCDTYIELELDNVDYSSQAYVSSVQEGTTTNLTREKVKNYLVNLKDQKSRSPLFYAQNKVMVDYWLSKGNKINAADSSGDNLLSYSISNDETCTADWLTFLISKGADVNFGAEEGNATPLARALQYNRGKEILELLTANGAKIENIKNTSNLFYYVQNVEQIAFLQDKGLSADIITENGFYVRAGGVRYIVKTPLAKAIANRKSIDIIKSLIEAGAKIDDANFEYKGGKFSALYFSTLALNDGKLTDFLLKNGGEKAFDLEKVFSRIIANENYKMLSNFITLGVVPKSTNNLDKLFHMLFISDENNEMLSRLIALGVMPKSAKNLDELFNIFLRNADIANVEKVLQAGYDVNKYEIGHYLSLVERDAPTFFNLLISNGYDVNKRSRSGNNVLDRILSGFSNVNLGNVSIDAFVKIVKNTSSLKDRGYSTNKLREIISVPNLRPEILNAFLDNCPSLDSRIIRDSLKQIFEYRSTVPETTIISLIKHVDNFNDAVNGKTMIGSALEYDSVSLDIIKAIGEKMYFPAVKTTYKYNKGQNPIDIANKLNLTEIAQYLKSSCMLISKGENDSLKIYGHIYLGMSRREYKNVIKYYPIGEGCNYIKEPDFVSCYDENDRLIALKFKYFSLFTANIFSVSDIQKNQFKVEPFTEYYEYENEYSKEVHHKSENGVMLSYRNENYILEFLRKEKSFSMDIYIISINARSKNNPYKGNGLFTKSDNCFVVFENKELKDNDANRNRLQSLLNKERSTTTIDGKSQKSQSFSDSNQDNSKENVSELKQRKQAYLESHPEEAEKVRVILEKIKEIYNTYKDNPEEVNKLKRPLLKQYLKISKHWMHENKELKDNDANESRLHSLPNDGATNVDKSQESQSFRDSNQDNSKENVGEQKDELRKQRKQAYLEWARAHPEEAKKARELAKKYREVVRTNPEEAKKLMMQYKKLREQK